MGSPFSPIADLRHLSPGSALGRRGFGSGWKGRLAWQATCATEDGLLAGTLIGDRLTLRLLPDQPGERDLCSEPPRRVGRQHAAWDHQSRADQRHDPVRCAARIRPHTPSR
jgi:hypothetical protein